MKATSDLPDDIAAVIDRAYRKSDTEFVRSRLRPTDRWEHVVRSIARDYMVKDQTDFNYGRAHVYDVFITTDERAVVARTKEQREMLQELGHVYFVRISISVLAPYFLLTFGEYRRSGREIKSTFSPRPFIKDQIHIAQQLTLEMERAGFRPLTEGLAETIVADVGTELRPQGTATVSDLIIGPY